ncbi:hypothetical protein LTR56_004128 [Elasticomyces elasticus]|nr:hypothetical protein LTR22_015333 [Elasticomyces elasticus]KAK3654075.1 hypothetical protein LTR56_004128 [Elasticomyces elasticus]KAK4914653.1 hypothetical protein LTR49_017094 [Elasticomyces elasticus]
MDGFQSIGRYLCLLKADAMEKHSGQVFAAVKKLRTSFDACFVATGTALEDTWAEFFAPASFMKGCGPATRSRPSEAFANGIMEDGEETSTLETR